MTTFLVVLKTCSDSQLVAQMHVFYAVALETGEAEDSPLTGSD